MSGANVVSTKSIGSMPAGGRPIPTLSRGKARGSAAACPGPAGFDRRAVLQAPDRLEVLLDRLDPPVAAGMTPGPNADPPDGQVEVVVDHEHAVRVDPVLLHQALHRLAVVVVHEGLGLDQQHRVAGDGRLDHLGVAGLHRLAAVQRPVELVEVRQPALWRVLR